MHIHCNNDVYHYLLLSPSMSHDVHSSEGHAIYIYAIRNTANDRRYIGSTTDMDNRYEQHKRKRLCCSYLLSMSVVEPM